ncbi:hypothetical protein [Priestia megaterium]|uniref:Uncharacterized protein n=1 Tax=Priestia megaterium TaxID=1404 RepID=A0A6M6DZ67_PRIMG|nr:hypothetical protein [Priestia megaterium]QJX80072.1 hypothetical protein FDZ14_28665 [Priestia megaterium]
MDRGFNEGSLKLYFKPYSQLYRNTQGVVEEMSLLIDQIELSNNDKLELIELAYLHKIGFSPKTLKTGFEALDGALYCKEKNYPLEIVSAVMFYSGAFEIVKRNFPDLMNVYLEHKYSMTSKTELYIDLLTYCDLHRSYSGLKLNFTEKLKEISYYYGEDHNLVNTFKSLENTYKDIINRVEAKKL